MATYGTRVCGQCGTFYEAATPRQAKCLACPRIHKKKSREAPASAGEAPLCVCGCGDKVKWGMEAKRWNNYLHGHEGTVRFKTEEFYENIDRPAWNKGMGTFKKCLICAKEFRSKREDHNYCSRECFHSGNSGESSFFYVDGSRAKYVMRQLIDNNNNKISVRKHILLMEQKLDRRLNTMEVVHHKDGNGLNNSLDNLHLFHCDTCHVHFHHCKNAGNGLNYEYEYKEAHSSGQKSREYVRPSYTMRTVNYHLNEEYK